MEGKMGDTQKSQTITTKLYQIAKTSKRVDEEKFPLPQPRIVHSI